MAEVGNGEEFEAALRPAPRGGTARGEAAEALAEALRELRLEIRERFESRGKAADQPGERFDWFEIFDELKRRVSTLGMAERSGEVDEFGMDELAVKRAASLLEFLRIYFFRVEVAGLDGVPTEGPVLFVANRSGLLPYDGLMISHLVARAHPRRERPRFLIADWLITLPFAQSFLARLGGVRACRENAERLLQRGHSVIAFPEGQKGAAKVFRERYRLKRFGRGGVVRVAIDAGVPLVPVAVVGAEEAHPILFRVENLARGAGLPFVPITPTFPWLGPLGLLPLPSKWSIRFGAPIATEQLDRDAGRDELLLSRMTEEVRQQIQEMVDRDLRARAAVFA